MKEFGDSVWGVFALTSSPKPAMKEPIFCFYRSSVGSDNGIITRIARTMPSLRKLEHTLGPLQQGKGLFDVREGLLDLLQKCVKLESVRIVSQFTPGKAQQKMLTMMILHLIQSRHDLKELDFTANDPIDDRFEGDEEPEDAEILAALQVYKARPTHIQLVVGYRFYRCQSRRVSSFFPR